MAKCYLGAWIGRSLRKVERTREEGKADRR